MYACTVCEAARRDTVPKSGGESFFFVIYWHACRRLKKRRAKTWCGTNIFCVFCGTRVTFLLYSSVLQALCYKFCVTMYTCSRIRLCSMEFGVSRGEAVGKLYHNYVQSARDRKRFFGLTYSEFEAICTKACHYCGRPPEVRSTAAVPVNGVDRVDNSAGYLAHNCVPCCKRCNMLKGSLTYEGFLSAIRGICKHIETQEPYMPEKACNKCGEFKAEDQYSVVDKASGRRGPTCKSCKASATKARRTAKPADRDPKGHEVEPAERPADEARPKADKARVESASADEALVEQAIEVLVKSADVPTKQTLCKCGRFQVLPGHERCLRCDRYC